MNIAIINNLYKPYNRGGAEKISEIQVEELKKLGAKVFVISLRPYFDKSDRLDDLYYLPSLFPNLDKMPKFLRLIWHLYDTINVVNCLKILHILKKNNIECVITNNLCGIGKIIIPFLNTYKHIHVLHDISLLHPSGLMYYKKESLINSFFARIYQKINYTLFKNVKNIISPSDWLLNLHLQKKFFKNAVNKKVILNPVNLQVYSRKRIKKEINEKFIFLYVGLISEHKGIRLLLEAWNNINAAVSKSVELILVGQVIDKRLIEGIEKKSNISLLGRKNSLEVNKLMQKADCLIVPSICYENSPTVIYEARANGLVVFASQLGGTTELVNRLGGYLFVPEAENLKKLIEKIILNPETFVNMTPDKQNSFEKLSPENYAREIMRIISKTS